MSPVGSVTIVVVNWNSGLQLRHCLASIRRHGDDKVLRVVVVDNGSTDGSEKDVDTWPGVTLIRAGCNLGFAAACNLGARGADGKYLLFLNPDAALLEQALQRAIAFMEAPANARVGICGVQLTDEQGRVARGCARFPAVTSLLCHTLGLDRLWPTTGYMMGEWDHLQSRHVDHVIGAFFLLRSRVFRELNGFDERFFVYLEDLDFSLRSHQAGWRSHYLAEARAFHAGGGTSRQVRARRLFYSLRSRLLYSFKHFSWPGAMMVLMATLLVEPWSRTAWSIARRSWPGLRETWGGYGMLLRWFPQWVIRGQTR